MHDLVLGAICGMCGAVSMGVFMLWWNARKMQEVLREATANREEIIRFHKMIKEETAQFIQESTDAVTKLGAERQHDLKVFIDILGTLYQEIEKLRFVTVHEPLDLPGLKAQVERLQAACDTVLLTDTSADELVARLQELCNGAMDRLAHFRTRHGDKL